MNAFVRAVLAILAALLPLLATHPPVHTPAVPVPAATPTTASGFLCRDGSTSHAAHRQGACSHHGGVA